MADLQVRVLPVRPKALSVSEFNRSVKGTLEQGFASVWIEGELTSCKIAASGHAYFDLKDDREDARVSCCLFKGRQKNVEAPLRDGERVQLRGMASLYPARGSFQLIVDAVLPAGVGGAAAALEALKKKLAAEGLLALERKRRLPTYPRAIGVVTALHGAAFADICRVLHRRWPARIVVANTLVQGAEAPTRIVAALQAIQRVPGVDVVIVGRGGGASDDLAAFNDERVARAIAACRVPVVSAVGHEVDHTLADLVADLRAATPSHAAEQVVPELSSVREQLRTQGRRLVIAARGRVDGRRVALQRLERRLGDPRRLTSYAAQRLDELLGRLANLGRRRQEQRRRSLELLQRRLQGAHPRSRLGVDRGRLAALLARLAPALEARLELRRRQTADLERRLRPSLLAALEQRRASFQREVARLDALSPLAILARGYGVVLARGKALTEASQVQPGDALELRLHRGELEVTVTAVREPGR